MPRLLRVIDGSKWDFADDLVAWQARNDLPGAVIGDLRPSATNRLSVWEITEGDGNLDRVIAGYAANRGNIDIFEARIIDSAEVEAIGITIERAPGQSKDREAARQWHWNLLDLTHMKLGALATLLAVRGIPIERNDVEVVAMIVASVRAGHIQLQDLKSAPPSEAAVWRVIPEALQRGHATNC